MAELKQWVNLEKDNKFVEDEVKSKERLGTCHFECKLDKGGKKVRLLKIKVEEISVPNKYSAAEERRNVKWFKLKRTKQTISPHSKNKFKLERELQLPAAGGNKYKITARYKRKVVKSLKKVETWRKLYYQAVHMRGITVPDMSAMESDYKSHYMIFKSKDPAGEVAFVNNTDSDSNAERVQVVKDAAAGYTISRYDPYAVCAFFVNMIASKRDITFRVNKSEKFKLWPGILAWFGSTLEYTVPDDNYLWWGVSTKDDAKNGGKGIWLVPNSAHYVGDDNKSRRIPDNKIRIDTTKKISALGGYNKILIDLPWSARDFWSPNTVRIEIGLIIVDGFSGGYSEPYVNIITVAKSGWFNPFTDAKRLQILNHELGHKVGMVPDGTGQELDKPPGHYTGKSHQGPHCKAGGLTYDPARGSGKKWHGVPSCVMFGATSCYDPTTNRHKGTTKDYCADCQKLVKKLNLHSPELDNFMYSVKAGKIF